MQKQFEPIAGASAGTSAGGARPKVSAKEAAAAALERLGVVESAGASAALAEEAEQAAARAKLLAQELKHEQTRKPCAHCGRFHG